jgi:hypothetical protein
MQYIIAVKLKLFTVLHLSFMAGSSGKNWSRPYGKHCIQRYFYCCLLQREHVYKLLPSSGRLFWFHYLGGGDRHRCTARRSHKPPHTFFKISKVGKKDKIKMQREGCYSLFWSAQNCIWIWREWSKCDVVPVNLPTSCPSWLPLHLSPAACISFKQY